MEIMVGHGFMERSPATMQKDFWDLVVLIPKMVYFWSENPPIFLEIIHYAFVFKAKWNIIESLFKKIIKIYHLPLTKKNFLKP